MLRLYEFKLELMKSLLQLTEQTLLAVLKFKSDRWTLINEVDVSRGSSTQIWKLLAGDLLSSLTQKRIEKPFELNLIDY